MKPKIVFMGTPEISVPFLEFIIKKNADIIVFTQKDRVRSRGKKLDKTPVKITAEEHEIPVYDCSIKSKEAAGILSQFKPDLYLVVAYGQILPQRILDMPKIAPINVHFSLLPAYRGATPVNTALLNGDTHTGTTLMFMDKGMDTGDIMYQSEITIGPDENASSLFDRLTMQSLSLLDTNWEEIISNNFTRTPQSGDASYTKMISKDDLILDFTLNAHTLHNKIRAFNAKPGTKCKFRKKILYIEKSSCIIKNTDGIPGEIIDVTKTSFTVACENGALCIEQLKPEGKKSMTAQAFIAGYKPAEGEKLI